MKKIFFGLLAVGVIGLAFTTTNDKEVVKVLDNTTNYLDSFTTFQSKLTCKTKKYLTLENLSLDCE